MMNDLEVSYCQTLSNPGFTAVAMPPFVEMSRPIDGPRTIPFQFPQTTP